MKNLISLLTEKKKKVLKGARPRGTTVRGSTTLIARERLSDSDTDASATGVAGDEQFLPLTQVYILAYPTLNLTCVTFSFSGKSG